MPDIVTKKGQKEIQVEKTTQTVVSLKSLKWRKSCLESLISKSQTELDDINEKISQAIALGVIE